MASQRHMSALRWRLRLTGAHDGRLYAVGDVKSGLGWHMKNMVIIGWHMKNMVMRRLSAPLCAVQHTSHATRVREATMTTDAMTDDV